MSRTTKAVIATSLLVTTLAWAGWFALAFYASWHHDSGRYEWQNTVLLAFILAVALTGLSAAVAWVSLAWDGEQG